MKFNEEIIQRIGENVISLLSAYINELDEAYLNCNEKKFSIGLGTKIEEADNGRAKIETSISFVKDRINAKVTDYVDIDQQSFNFKKEVNV
ncbi:MAG: hypothetical protein JRJ29_11565 [Deltaproteobacteria bacterium]|nr:hypothetical protein [Deltaproteobacteria bacterium]